MMKRKEPIMSNAAYPHYGPRPEHLACCPSYMSESEFLLAKKTLGAGVTGSEVKHNGLTLCAESFEGGVAQRMAQKGWLRILRRVNARIRVAVTSTIYDDMVRAIQAH